MGYSSPIGLVSAIVSAGLASMVALGSYGYLRDRKRWGYWKAGAGAGAVAAGVGAGIHLAMSFFGNGGTAGLGLVSMRPAMRGLTMRRLRGNYGLLTSQQIGAMPTVVAGVTAEMLSGGCVR
jgi:hypothetical protein